MCWFIFLAGGAVVLAYELEACATIYLQRVAS
jgi:hypothetical protein